MLKYRARVLTKPLYWAYCDAEACRRAAMIEIAMIMYRSDHDEYPATIAELAPDYLQREPLDPYTMRSFPYLPRGLDQKLRQFENNPAGDVKPHTPFFWSVGRYDQQLRRQADVDHRVGIDSDDSPESQSLKSYVLNPSDAWQGWWAHHLLFKLPQ